MTWTSRVSVASRGRRGLAGVPGGLLFLLLVAGVSMVLVLAGCEGQVDREPEEVGVEPGAAAVDDPAGLSTEGVPPTGAGTDVASGGAAVVSVRLHGRTIEMPATVELPRDLPGGEITFAIANTGDMEHSFEIEGNGIERKLDNPLQPGQSANLTVALEPGTYTVYCPVANHQAEGMETQLTVTQ